MKVLPLAGLLVLAGCMPMSQERLAEKYPPVSHHVDGELFDVYQHTLHWARQCLSAIGELYEGRGFATIQQKPGLYEPYQVRLSRAAQGGTDVAVSSAWDYMARDFARWTRGETGCNPPGFGN